MRASRSPTRGGARSSARPPTGCRAGSSPRSRRTSSTAATAHGGGRPATPARAHGASWAADAHRTRRERVVRAWATTSSRRVRRRRRHRRRARRRDRRALRPRRLGAQADGRVRAAHQAVPLTLPGARRPSRRRSSPRSLARMSAYVRCSRQRSGEARDSLRAHGSTDHRRQGGRGARPRGGRAGRRGLRRRARPRPGLATILVGDDPASAVYVGGKQKACAEVGIDGFDHRLPADTPREDVGRADRAAQRRPGRQRHPLPAPGARPPRRRRADQPHRRRQGRRRPDDRQRRAARARDGGPAAVHARRA